MPYFENRGALVAEELRFDIGFGRSSLDLEMVRFGSKYLLESKKKMPLVRARRCQCKVGQYFLSIVAIA